MSDRAFGVEIECGLIGEERWSQDHFVKAQKIIRAGGYRSRLGWTTTQDGSGIELRTPKLRGSAGMNDLHEVMAYLRDNGFHTTRVDGLHVHHDAPEFKGDHAAIIRLMQTWIAVRDHFTPLVARTRLGIGACPLITEEHVENFDKGRYVPRGDLNINSLRHKGSIEIRLHEGTLDSEQAEAWILLGQSFIRSVAQRKRVMACPDSREVLMNRLRTPKPAKERYGDS